MIRPDGELSAFQVVTEMSDGGWVAHRGMGGSVGGWVAQMIERQTAVAEVPGSNPASPKVEVI